MTVAEALVRGGIAEIPPLVRAWVPPELLAAWVSMQVTHSLRMAVDLATARRYHLQYPVDGATDHDYRLKLISIAGLGQLSAMIAFRYLSLDEPFIDVLDRSFRLESPDVARRVAHELAEHFAVFKPKSVHVNVWGAPWPHAPDLLCDFRLVAAPVGLLRAGQPVPPHYDTIRLERAHSLRYYDQYSSAYDHYHAAFPHMKDAVYKDSRARQKTYMAMGEVFNAFLGEAWLGLISTIPIAEMYLHGVMVADVIIAPEFRGRGCAAALQRHCMEQLRIPDETLIIGTIHPQNLPSLKTALRLGRVDLGGGYHVLLPQP